MQARRAPEPQESRQSRLFFLVSVLSELFIKMPLTPRLFVSVIGVRHDQHWIHLLHFQLALHFLEHKHITIRGREGESLTCMISVIYNLHTFIYEI